eukprot:Nk52_evm8s303 gene=Nk52_evmTU8s303
MMDSQQLGQLEGLCQQIYEASDNGARERAEGLLASFTEGIDHVADCQYVLQNSSSSYAQMFVLNALSKILTKNFGLLSVEQRVELKKFIISFLGNRPDSAYFVIQQAIVLLAQLVKVGWFDSSKGEFVYRQIVKEAEEFFNASPDHCIIGVSILSRLITEISSSDLSRSLTKHRKISSSFRDTCLFGIFETSLRLLKQIFSKSLNIPDPEKEKRLLDNLLTLARNCLNYDFIGTSPDESMDDFGTIQIPANWRTTIMLPETMQLFFDMYGALQPPQSALAMECLVHLASVRRSLFNDPERAKYLNQLATGIISILRNSTGLSDISNYHEFCRLLARLKSNYQMGELVNVDHYSKFIELACEFTKTSLKSWQWSPNSTHYLLSLWQRMVSSMPYVKSENPHLLDTYAPQVTQAYIVSRVESMHTIANEGLDNPLEELDALVIQLEQFSVIGRCEYEKTCSSIVSIFDSVAQQYQELIQQINNSQGAALPAHIQKQLLICEGQLTWVVFIIGAVIGGRVIAQSDDADDLMDGELACRVIQLMGVIDTRPSHLGTESLDLAILSFFHQFRKIYIGDQVQKSSRVYTRLAEVLGMHDQVMLLNVFIRKIVSNLKRWYTSDNVVTRCLQIVSDLTLGYSSVRMLAKLDTMNYIMGNHSGQEFPFLDVPSNSRHRTTFYKSLGRLLFIDSSEEEGKFEAFMRPFTNVCENMGSLMQQGRERLRQEDVKHAVIGLCRDLRGIVSSCTRKNNYMMLFDWIYPKYMSVLLSALEVWYDTPEVTTPFLKFYAEFVQNKSQRLQFDISSPNGILLFRQTSKVLNTYGCILNSNIKPTPDRVYQDLYKGMWICFRIFEVALCGNYVNFGVFQLYGDDTLEKAVQIYLKMIFTIPTNDILAYPKLATHYFSSLEVFTQDHMNFIANLDPPVFACIVSSLAVGIKSIDSAISTQCCMIVDHLVSFEFKHLQKQSKMVQNTVGISHLIAQYPDALPQMLSHLLNAIMFEDCSNQWSLSRPLLPLIFLCEKSFNNLRQSLIQSQPSSRQSRIQTSLEELMQDIDRSLSPKNRDRFTQNVTIFRREITNLLRSPVANQENNGLDTMASDM